MDLMSVWEIEEVEQFARVALLVGAGFVVLQLAGFGLSRLTVSRENPHAGQLLRKLVVYVGSLGILFSVLLELGFDLTGLLATAGLATVAIGFAAQTSLSNLISGLFLIGEKPFKIGDLVRVNTTLGVVESIDLLSIKIRTLDNLFVRIPNESMIKEPVINVTRFPIRRMDLEIGVAYKEDIREVLSLLKELAGANPYALDDPEPLILFDRFGDSALQIRFGIWFEKSNYLALRNRMMMEIKERFDAEGIEIPFPHVTVYSGSATEPFPVAMEPVEGERGK